MAQGGKSWRGGEAHSVQQWQGVGAPRSPAADPHPPCPLHPFYMRSPQAYITAAGVAVEEVFQSPSIRA